MRLNERTFGGVARKVSYYVRYPPLPRRASPSSATAYLVGQNPGRGDGLGNHGHAALEMPANNHLPIQTITPRKYEVIKLQTSSFSSPSESSTTMLTACCLVSGVAEPICSVSCSRGNPGAQKHSWLLTLMTHKRHFQKNGVPQHREDVRVFTFQAATDCRPQGMTDKFEGVTRCFVAARVA